MADGAPRVLVVDDHELLGEALELALARVGFDQVGMPDDLSDEGIMKAVEATGADVVLLDLHLGPDRTSLGVIESLVASGVMVLMLTGSRDSTLLAECIERGAVGLFDKGQPFSQLVELIKDTALGHTVLEPAARQALLAALRQPEGGEEAPFQALSSLSRREAEVLVLLTRGKAAEEIAADLYVSLATVRSHVRSILSKLGVNSPLAAIVLAQRAGWSPDPYQV